MQRLWAACWKRENCAKETNLCMQEAQTHLSWTETLFNVLCARYGRLEPNASARGVHAVLCAKIFVLLQTTCYIQPARATAAFGQKDRLEFRRSQEENDEVAPIAPNCQMMLSDKLNQRTARNYEGKATNVRLTCVGSGQSKQTEQFMKIIKLYFLIWLRWQYHVTFNVCLIAKWVSIDCRWWR